MWAKWQTMSKWYVLTTNECSFFFRNGSMVPTVKAHYNVLLETWGHSRGLRWPICTFPSLLCPHEWGPWAQQPCWVTGPGAVHTHHWVLAPVLCQPLQLFTWAILPREPRGTLDNLPPTSPLVPSVPHGPYLLRGVLLPQLWVYVTNSCHHICPVLNVLCSAISITSWEGIPSVTIGWEGGN